MDGHGELGVIVGGPDVLGSIQGDELTVAHQRTYGEEMAGVSAPVCSKCISSRVTYVT